MATISEAFSMAVEHHRAGRIPAAEGLCRQILQVDPQHANAWHLLGVIGYQIGNHAAAVDCIQRALRVNPAVPEYHCNLGNALQSLGQLDQAADSYRQALALKPELIQAHNNLGNTLKSLGRLDEAVASYRHALAANPNFELAHNNLGVALKDQGQLEEAIACYRQALTLKPDFVAAHTNLLSALQYRPGVTLAELADAHAEFERRHAVPLRAAWRPHLVSRDPERRLRLGFVSADFGQHPVGYFLIRALEHLDPQQAEIVCYSERGIDDELTARFQVVASIWRKVVGWGEQRLADQIRDDQIDILFDLSGHTGGNRLFVFARKPAPLQITWIGYEGTTGLASMDFILADRHEIPVEAERHYTERVLRLPDGFVCFDPPSDSPPVRELSATRQGFVTFGSFNNPAKINREVARVWSAILRRVPTARLRLKYRGLSDAGTQNRFREMFAAHGADVSRIDFEGKSSRAEYLEAYNQVDIALDPFPFSGGITTCEALWMGVPVVTCPGETFASRHTLSHLSNIGLTETMATNFDEYVEVAVRLASDLEHLAALRARLRQQVATSPLCDGSRFAANLMNCLRHAWRAWVETQPAGQSLSRPIAAASESKTSQDALAVAVSHHQAGRLQAAEAAYRQILQADPQCADAWHLLGVIAAQTGNHPAAIENIRRALETNPSSADYHSNLGNALTAVGRLDDAIASYRNALALRPDFAEAHNNMGNALKGRGDFDEAVAVYRRALAIKPGYAEAHYNLGSILKDQGEFAEAAACFRQALTIRPTYVEAHFNLGNLLSTQSRFGEAVACFRQALAIKPEYIEAHCNLGNALKDQGELAEAIACYRQALAIKPGSAEAHLNLGNSLKDQGKLDEAIACYRQALELKPGFVEAHTSLLLTLQYREGVTLAELADAHAEFERLHAAPLHATWRPHEHLRDPDRRLRLGFVSGDFARHPVGFLLIRTLEHFDRQQAEIICYSDRLKEDDLTVRFRRVSTTWRTVTGWSDERLADQVRGDKIDILFDLSGHTAGNRLLVFARKPAPIQVTWLGYVGTTGLSAMDYIIADRHEIPVGAEKHYREKILRMPDGYLCYDPPSEAPPVSPLPAAERGFVTFGCFNNPSKLSPTVIENWAKILRRVPTALLVLKYQGMSDQETSRRLADLFASHGVDPGRIECLGNSPHPQLLAEYQRIDLALDSSPYSGGLTTCEALWMGVPVVTCPGETFASRHSLSHLSNIGLTETIARDVDEYVEIAVRLANDLERLAAIRARLRQQVASSPLCDGSRFAANLMNLLREAWRAWVETQPAGQSLSKPIAAAAESKSNQDALAVAVSHQQAGRLPAAAEICRQIVQADPQFANAWHLLGVIAAQTGNPAAAVEHIGRALQANPSVADYHSNLGNALSALGRLDDAVASYRKAIELRSDFAEAHNNLGNVLKRQGRLEDAAAAYRRALAIKPAYADALQNLGNTLKDQRRWNEAAGCYRRVIELKPDHVDAHYRLGITLQMQGQLEPAMASYRQALALKPGYAEAHNNLGIALKELGRLEEAVVCGRQAVALKPAFAEGHLNLGNALKDQGQLAEAVACYRQALAVKPSFAEAHNNLGTALKDQGRDEEALACFREALALKPDSAEAHNNLGNSLKDQGQLEEAVASYRRALALMPGFAEAHNNLGNALKDQGLVEEAVACFQQALKLDPRYVVAHSNLLCTLQYRPTVTPMELAEAHAEFDRRHAAPLRAAWQPHVRSREPNRRLRLGFVSSDFGRHPVGHFLIRALEQIDPQQAEVVCYSRREIEDDMTARFRAASTMWRKVVSWSDQRLADQIRADQIDVLFDLAGHTSGNRLLVFARKPAPVQITWLGYEGTTGLAAMDFILADRHEIPADAERYYVEKVLRLPDGFVCFDPPSEAPAVRELPAASQGFVTFGSFNNPAKINSDVARVWSAILQRVPTARLRLKYRGLADAGTQNRLRELFADNGADVSRLEFEGKSPRAEYLDAYNRIDIALDPFPFSGGITTCEALWMGVPVVTCPGETFASRHTLSHLSNIGLTETIARDFDDYVDVAVRLANDLDHLAELRSRLRSQVAASPLCDGRRFAAGLMNCVREAWRTWHPTGVESQPPESQLRESQLLERNPGAAEAHCQQGAVLQGQGKFDEAMACYRQALALKPGYAEAHYNLGTAFKSQGRLDQAVACYRQALALNPNFVLAHLNLGNALKSQGQLDQAESCYRQALALNPDFAEAHNNLGTALNLQGKLDEGLASFRKALELNPDFVAARRNLLGTLQYRPGVTLSELADAHAEFQQRHAAPLRATWRPHENSRDPDRPLKLGFVSPDFGCHPVGYFLIRALEHLDRQHAQIVCYSNRSVEDEMTARFQAASHIWRKVADWSDERLAEQIRDDEIDILFDLAGHTAGNRLLVFARKPAPIQITWLGYEGTTGLSAIDYILADHHEIPVEADRYYAEKVLRLPNGFVCFEPPEEAPAVGELPATSNGYVTFGSFNNPAKINPEVVRIWSAILQRVPDAKLRMKYRGLTDALTQNQFRQLFAKHGIDTDRLEFHGSSSRADYFATYNRVDIALDSFPFNGGVTTCDALWMGVPVVNCPTETFAGRHTLSHLSNIGLTETIARDFEEYVELAVELANDLDRLARVRAGLRQQVRASLLCDGPRFAANLLNLLREVWNQWIELKAATRM